VAAVSRATLVAVASARILRESDLGRRIDGRAVTIRDAWAVERPLLLGLPAEPFDACETAAPRVDAKSLVTIRQNRYSVPVALAGLKVSARIGAREITINHAGVEVARHERLHGKFGTSAQLDHYLELLHRKPGGLEHSVVNRPGFGGGSGVLFLGRDLVGLAAA